MRINNNIKIVIFFFPAEPLAKNVATALETKHELVEANGEVAKLILDKSNRVLSKNNGRVVLQRINSIHNNTTLDKMWNSMI